MTNDSELLHKLVLKFAGGSYALAAHYADCSECHVVGVAVDHECPKGKKLEDEAFAQDGRS